MANRVVKDFEFPESFGFSGSSGKTMVRGYARGGKAKSDKVGKVMKEFKEGTLHSGKDGPVVKNRKQAIAIAMSEAERGKKKGHAKGGRVHEDRAEDIKLIREELKKWEEKEERDEEKEDESEGEEMKKGGKVKKKKKEKELPVVRVSPPLMNPNARAVPVFNSEPLVGMRRGGKAK